MHHIPEFIPASLQLSRRSSSTSSGLLLPEAEANETMNKTDDTEKIPNTLLGEALRAIKLSVPEALKWKSGEGGDFNFSGWFALSVGGCSARQGRRRRPVKPDRGAPAGPAQVRRGARRAGVRATGSFRRSAAARRAKA